MTLVLPTPRVRLAWHSPPQGPHCRGRSSHCHSDVGRCRARWGHCRRPAESHCHDGCPVGRMGCSSSKGWVQLRFGQRPPLLHSTQGQCREPKAANMSLRSGTSCQHHIPAVPLPQPPSSCHSMAGVPLAVPTVPPPAPILCSHSLQGMGYHK